MVPLVKLYLQLAAKDLLCPRGALWGRGLDAFESIGETKLLPLEDAEGVVREDLDALEVVKWRELLSKQEHALDACKNVANAVSGVVMKNA